MSNITVFESAGLPAPATLTTALRAIQTETGGLGVVLLKMDKTGHWVFGADQTEVEAGSEWAVNPFSFVHGWIAWGDGDVLGEQMAPMTQPLPEQQPAPTGARKGWELQVGFSAKCLSGQDAGLEVRYAATSVGGKKAVQQLALEIADHIDGDQTTPVPIVTLGKDHYQHKLYGRIFTPVFEVLRWVGMEGEQSESTVAEEPAAPARRRRIA